MDVTIMTAQVDGPDGSPVALIERAKIGGGTQVVTVDGVPEERVHPVFWRYHVRFLSPDRMIPDELRETETYDEAVDLALRFAAKRLEHAAAVDDLARALKMD